ncbi:hypothetical protein [Bradyrhizobium sp. G127]|uniref:hypothetical protein n=1 Tax=Bradyrhizobium sp. G127 TaxID=2904800 RepID=UPI001F2B5D3A|nr:hypothetical protein [Bradyrhizobium sp. G127]MCF2523229.1 hypothetical protein [Bradyrhizobium sp. G127]
MAGAQHGDARFVLWDISDAETSALVVMMAGQTNRDKTGMSGAEPKFIEMEAEFARFVRTFRGGTVVRDLIPDAPHMALNADYYFSSDDVIAELKCLYTDPSDQEQLNKRFLSVCQRLGYSAEQALQIAFREIPLPRAVAQGVIAKSLNHIRKTLRKANHQIAATKRQLGRLDALGLVIISNENNLASSPIELIHFMSRELSATMKDSHIDGVIYMTANLYHPVGGDGVARSLWLPGYRRAGTRLTDFVDNLGVAWHKFREELDGSLVPSTRLHEPPLGDFDVRPSQRTSQR